MKVAVVGGGPGGLYFALLLRKRFPRTAVTVYERNRADDTYGWGVVFSDETLGGFREADSASYAEITRRFRYWQDIETFYRGTRTVSTGHGFAALSRQELLAILQKRCEELDVTLHFEQEVADVEALRASHDLVVAADGVNSPVRRRYARQLRSWVDWRQCRFCWLGTDLPLAAFSFIFEETPHGLFQVHAYPFAAGLSTWIVECREEVWRAAGLEGASEEDTVAFCEELFAEHLQGHRLLANRSIWRRFPTVQCETWRVGNLVLLGDAAHTAHFSVGSGTKLAMEDAMALAAALEAHAGGAAGIEAALAAYEDERWVEVIKLQKAAQTSLEWFENAPRYMGQHPLELTFNLMTRSKRITYDELMQRDPALVARLNEWFQREVGDRPAPCLGVEAGSRPLTPAVSPPTRRGGREEPTQAASRHPTPRSGGSPAPPPMFAPFRLRELELANRIVVSPMCQYSAADGLPDDWHLVHLGSRALGGAGLVITEMTDVSPEGRITPGCTGLWNTEQTAAWRRIVQFVHAHSDAKIAIQLAHAGRKGSVRHPWEGEDVPLGTDEGAWETLAPSPVCYRPGWPVPLQMSRDDMDLVREQFVAAARRAEAAGFDMIELHMAHGYLLSSFLSPLCNARDDEYGGSMENRMRFPLEVFRAMREAWPAPQPIGVRVTATDWMRDDSGTTPEDTVAVARALRDAGCDVVDVSSGGNSPESEPDFGRMYQVPFAEQVRYQARVPVMAVGAILGADHANTVLAAGRADLAVMARPHLHDPYLTLHAAERYEFWNFPWPGQYLPARPRPPREGRRPLRPYGEPEGWGDRLSAAPPPRA
ncbi:MAG TPA: bifunctional salicylyl-CoA 5-hydroxylase/oxidoreductase [Thermoanaerobaculia bacterium]|nr:bifunctional salicylyl-CoA 5-hydroxylase/oxidoreductase [Thermoanaerobaculia bacterium]